VLTRISLLVTIFLILNRNPLTYLFHDYSVFLGGIGSLITFAIFLFEHVGLRGKRLSAKKPKINSLDVMLILFVGYVLLRGVLGADSLRSVVGVALYLGFAPFYLIGKAIKLGEKEIFKAILFSFGYLTFFGYMQWLFALPLGEMQMDIDSVFSQVFPFRITSTLGSSLHFGVIYASILTFMNAKVLFGQGLSSRVLLLFLVNLFAVPLIIGSYSRGAMLLYLIASGVLFLHVPQKKKITLYASAFLGAAAIVVYLANPGYVNALLQRYSLNFENLSDFRRFRRYGLILSILSDKPLWVIFGAGLGYTGNIIRILGFESIFEISGLPEIYGTDIFTTESYPLKVLLELGALGVALFYGFYLIVVKASTILSKISSSKRWFYIGTLASFIAIFINSITLQNLEIPAVAYLFWFVGGKISGEMPALIRNRNG